MLGSDAELDFMLQDAGVPVVYNGTSTFGLLDASDVDIMDQQGMRTFEQDTKVGIRDGSLTALVCDAQITVNGALYTIRQIGPVLADRMRYLRVVPTATVGLPVTDGSVSSIDGSLVT